MAPNKGLAKKRKREKQKEADGYAEAFSDRQQNDESDWWHDFLRRTSTSASVGMDNEAEKFKSFFRVSKKTFDYICSLVKEDFLSRPSSSLVNVEGKALSVENQVAIALKRLASGESQLSVGEAFGVGQSIVSQVTWKFVEVMEEHGLQHLKWPDASEMEKIKGNFERIQGMPNCCGVIDVTHIVMSLASSEASAVWHDHESNYSMLLQAVVDPDMKFRDILTGWPGSLNDYRLLKNSCFFRLCESGKRLNGRVKDLAQELQIREYVIGDTGYPLLPWLITPYQGRENSPSKMRFNARHHATRMVAERALARFKATWRIIDGVMWRPDKHKLPRIILVCCLLHNIIIDLEDELQQDVALSQHHDAGYKQQLCQCVDSNAETLRDKLTTYLSENLHS
ncbi:hypothetical protein SUGI_0039060 [Cryptomeria japonica]|uniref:protein ANTAGONIST OF LIKE HETEROCHROMATIN PROTEIN 1 n=1 Tax=Cryptomeria japonica TaxID=3369 RepID=UPI002408C642|nr:protein ANTAGONIST OF LIKE HETEROCHROMATIN PROTEIN 1 [Cryptomeria japonica]GLJ06430.1 hypothetical protein SUGI_0039060 [Cryptomeria japonica]